MKRILLVIHIFICALHSQSQTINIPDRNFKIALINTLSADLNGDGNYDSDVDTNNDNEIQVSEAEAVLKLDVGLFQISSLEGIEYFKNIETLYCDYNKLTNINISKNTKLKFLDCTYNQLKDLNITKNLNLEELYCPSNNLTELNVSKHTNLSYLECAYNEITTLDLSKNTKLTALLCFRNKLTSLNLKNNNNNILTTLSTKQNSDLTCIEVDDVTMANNKSNWIKDDIANYSIHCNVLNIADFQNDFQILCYPNPVQKTLNINIPISIKVNKISVYNSLGNLILEKKSNLNQLDFSNLNKGVYLIVINTNKNSYTKRIIKK